MYSADHHWYDDDTQATVAAWLSINSFNMHEISQNLRHANVEVRDRSFSTFAKCFEKPTFLTL